MWANALATSKKQISRITEEGSPGEYRALYLIRVCLPYWPLNSDLAPLIHAKGGARECALNLIVQHGDFAELPVRFCSHTDTLMQRN
jgi:hypothetical protein